MSNVIIIIPPLQRSWNGILVSRRPSVCPSVCGQNLVRSVFSTILARSISYLHILSSNFRSCVACKGYCKISKFGKICGKVFKFVTLICLIKTWDLIWVNSMGNCGAAEVFSERMRSSCSSFHRKAYLFLDIDKQLEVHVEKNMHENIREYDIHCISQCLYMFIL